MPLDFVGWKRLANSATFASADAQNKLTASPARHKRSEYWRVPPRTRDPMHPSGM